MAIGPESISVVHGDGLAAHARPEKVSDAADRFARSDAVDADGAIAFGGSRLDRENDRKDWKTGNSHLV